MKYVALLFLFLAQVLFLFGSESPNLGYISTKYWHDVLATEINVNKNQFKLYPGTAPTLNTSAWMWSIFDAVTSINESIYYNPSQLNSFSSDYGLLLYKVKTSAFVDSICPLNQAIVKYSSTENQYAWDRTVQELNLELSSAKPESINQDTTFLLLGDTVVINVKAFFDHIVVFYSYPYSVKDTLDPILKKYSPWFTPCMFTKIYDNTDQGMLTPVDWQSAFGTEGYLQQVCVALVVVNGGYYTVSSTYKGIDSVNSTTFTSPVLLGVVLYPTDTFVTSLPK